VTIFVAYSPSRYAEPENLKSSDEISQTRQGRRGIFAERQPVCRHETAGFSKSEFPCDFSDAHRRWIGAKHRGAHQF
jgi:hypothetical protein